MLCFSILSLAILFPPAIYCQFISYISENGLRGNITFEEVEEDKSTSLVIESFVESDIFKRFPKTIAQAQKLEWEIHTNALHQGATISCSNEDLGPILSENLITSLTGSRHIVLNKLNRWVLPMQNLLRQNSVKTLSALIWGRSIRFKLSTNDQDEKPNVQGIETSPVIGEIFNKPRLSSLGSSPQNISSKPPNFAPRPRPSISGSKPKLSAPSLNTLPKPEALVMDSTTIASIEDGPRLNQTSTQTIELTPTNNQKRSIANLRRVGVCSNIIDRRNVKTLESIFTSQIAGKVVLRGNEDDTTIVISNLYHLISKVTTRHDWKILASDILDNRRHDDQCRYLETLFDPNNVDDSGCKRNEHEKCKIGDLMGKHGPIVVVGQGKISRTTLLDLNLPISSLEGSRSLFLVIYENNPVAKAGGGATIRQNILSCAQINPVNGRKLEALFNMDGVRGSIKVTQRYPTEPATLTYDLFGLEGNIKHQSIRELPLPLRTSSDSIKMCNKLGEVYNPTKIDPESSDLIMVGNLSAKHGQLIVVDSEYEDHYMGEFTDSSIQLFGQSTVAGRSIVIHKNNGDPWTCATLNHADEPVILAAASFYYPVVGKITFQQLANQPYSETGVLVEVYHPNGERDSSGHNWLIHLKPAMADFYNWSDRCESAGEVYDPVQVASGLSNDQYTKLCQSGIAKEPFRCRSGDLSSKSGFKLILPVSHLNRKRFYYTDSFLPLSMQASIIGRSLVIYDEDAPKQRGNRMACSTIKPLHSLKASIKLWNSGPSIPSAVQGSVVFEQVSPDRPTRVKIDLNGFNGNVENYAIHNVWTMDDREFPCSNDSLYDIYDPYDNENLQSLPPSAHYGSMATVDRVKVGDMSRKYGTFEGLQSVQKSTIDANMPLFAPRSIIGRSMVLRAAVNDFRWVCGGVDLDYERYDPIIALASFDDPRSKVAGYVRFVQLDYRDGSYSDTFVQIDLKTNSDGLHEPQTSAGHNWAIFVNQVGADAYIAAEDVRCLAAGFKWNPYLARDSQESYSSSCSPNEQQACAMGDLGMRHGSLTLGPNNRRAISDSNLPLRGNYSIMGRSLVVFDSKKPSLKLACANIFPDIHLKTNVVIKRTPSFTVSRFVDQMRSLLGVSEWLLVPELKATKSVANGQCVQMAIHFYGQRAHQIQIELNNLITLGTVRKSSTFGTEKISTHYKLCRVDEKLLTSPAVGIHNQLLYALVVQTCIFLTAFMHYYPQTH